MRAGKLDREIVIEAPGDTTISAAGTPSQGWQLFATVRAEKLEGAIVESVRDYGETQGANVVFRIRYLAGLTTVHRVTSEGRILNIREISEIGRRRGLELRCEEVRS